MTASPNLHKKGQPSPRGPAHRRPQRAASVETTSRPRAIPRRPGPRPPPVFLRLRRTTQRAAPGRSERSPVLGCSAANHGWVGPSTASSATCSDGPALWRRLSYALTDPPATRTGLVWAAAQPAWPRGRWYTGWTGTFPNPWPLKGTATNSKIPGFLYTTHQPDGFRSPGWSSGWSHAAGAAVTPFKFVVSQGTV